jgi:4a-hydroxytetrahydrobiopterin dehydratase
MTLLSAEDIDRGLADLPGWGGDPADIRCKYVAPDFPAAIALVDAVAVAAEEANHHPDIDIRWRDVLFVLSTHSAGGVTDKDLRLAGRIDGIARGMGIITT